MTAIARSDRAASKDYRPAILGCGLSGMMLLQLVGKGSGLFIQVSSFMMLFLTLMIALSYPKTNRLNAMLVLLVSAFSLIIVMEAFRAAEFLGAAVFFRAVGVLMFLALGLLLATRKDHGLLERALPVYAVTFVGVLVIVLLDNDRQWDRLRGHMHPNLWAFVAATAMVGIMTARIPLYVRYFLIAFVAYMLAMEFQTRGALIWSSLTIGCFGLLYALKGMRLSKRPLLHLSLYVVIFIALTAGFLASLDYLLVEVLAVNSATRGLDTGFTGRGMIWAEYLTRFAERPLLGHGFDMSRYVAENFLTDAGGRDISSTHNSYLTMLFDTGLVGFAIYITLLALMILGALRSGALMPFIMVFLLSGITESRPLNVGNPSGLLFVLLIPYCAASAFGLRQRFAGHSLRRSTGRQTLSAPAINVNSV